LDQFSVTIQTAIGKRVFFFDRLHYLERKVYRVHVFGQYRNRYFSVEYKEREWEVARPELLDYWMAEAVDELIAALNVYAS
jgi:hypothetical protein